MTDVATKDFPEPADGNEDRTRRWIRKLDKDLPLLRSANIEASVLCLEVDFCLRTIT